MCAHLQRQPIWPEHMYICFRHAWVACGKHMHTCGVLALVQCTVLHMVWCLWHIWNICKAVVYFLMFNTMPFSCLGGLWQTYAYLLCAFSCSRQCIPHNWLPKRINVHLCCTSSFSTHCLSHGWEACGKHMCICVQHGGTHCKNCECHETDEMATVFWHPQSYNVWRIGSQEQNIWQILFG